jgi:hypothetical protein
MRFLVIYRCTPRENLKRRPEYYSKHSCLASFLRAIQGCSRNPEVVFLADGELPQSMLAPMSTAGEVLPAGRSGIVGSYLSAIDLALERLDDDDLVYLAEEDYLYLEHAFAALLAAADALPQASYFGLYASIIMARSQGFWVDDVLWHTADSTTHSFAARAGVLRADRRLHALTFRVGSVHDTELCLAYQGHMPYPWRPLLTDGQPRRAVGRAWVNGIAWRRGFRPRMLVAAHPALATHVELPYLAEGTDWEAVATRERAAVN